MELCVQLSMLVVSVIAYVVFSGLDEMNGGSTVETVRFRNNYSTDEEWLLSNYRKEYSVSNLEGTLVQAASAAEVERWDVAQPPRLRIDGASHLYNFFGDTLTHLLFPDIVINPEPVNIHAPPDKVWEVLMDFAMYPKWNPFHRKVEIVERDDGRILVR